MAKKNISVVVLGDVGRSPRMQYHALSFAEHDFHVDVIGYGGTVPNNNLVEHKNCRIHVLREVPKFVCPQLLAYALKTIWQTVTLFLALLLKRRSQFVLVQNPPAIPTLFVCWFYCLIVGAKLIIDWHNYANSILALSLGRDHKLVKLATWIESFFGAKAHLNFCVTRAMQNDLRDRWGIKAHVLYDRPPDIFKPISVQEKHEFFLRISQEYSEFCDPAGTEDKTAFTLVSANGTIKLREDRPGLLVSSTSWTPDEDFCILFNALRTYEESVTIRNLPKLICVITGKGPLKDYYLGLMEKENWRNVKVLTPWLEIEDYPLILAAADLGVCLHTSSSGLDLPMKVVDMFGCGLPVCAYNFQCLHELVKHEVNSYTFADYEALSIQIENWFIDFPKNEKQQKTCIEFKIKLENFRKLRWQENWITNVLPAILAFDKNK